MEIARVAGILSFPKNILVERLSATALYGNL
jgi:hypothetical protein